MNRTQALAILGRRRQAIELDLIPKVRANRKRTPAARSAMVAELQQEADAIRAVAEALAQAGAKPAGKSSKGKGK